MGQLSENTVNHGDLEAYHDELMQSEVMPRTNKGIGNEAVCQTAAATAAKTIIAPAGFSLTNGATIIVTFANAIGVANATLALGTAVDDTADDYSEKNPASEGWYVLSGGTFVLTEDTTPQNGTTYYTVSAAKPIYYRGAALGANLVKAGSQVILRYNGTQFCVIGDLTPSGFAISYDTTTGRRIITAIGSASVSHDDVNGRTVFTY